MLVIACRHLRTTRQRAAGRQGTGHQHERLYTSKNLGRIDMRDYLEGLASDLSSTHAGTRPVELCVRADELYLSMDQAVPVGLIVNELVTNSYKHAFPERLGRTGRIEIALERMGEDLQLAVRDDGIGYAQEPDPGTADSLGLLLISSLSRQLEADLRFERLTKRSALRGALPRAQPRQRRTGRLAQLQRPPILLLTSPH